MNLEDFAMRCGWPPKEDVVRARLSALDMLVACRRCKGSGKYEHNPLDSKCYGCAGAGKKLPPLTARLAATIRQRQDARPSKTLSEWALRRGAYVYNHALLDRVTDSEFEDRIGKAIHEAYEQGFRRGRQTREEELGA